jgi:hypothetical protein
VRIQAREPAPRLATEHSRGDVTGWKLVGHLRHHHGRRSHGVSSVGDPCLDTSVCLVGFLRLPVVPAGVSGSLCFAGASCIIGLINC